MKLFAFMMIPVVVCSCSDQPKTKACNYRIEGLQVTTYVESSVSCKEARKEIVSMLAEQKRITACIAAGGDEDACWLDTTTYEESPEPCTTDMECVEKYSHDCYIVRDVIDSDGKEYILEWLPDDDDEDNFKRFSSLKAAQKAADKMFCMDGFVASNCFMSSRETCSLWNESWEDSKDYVKWHINNERRIEGETRMLK